MRILLLTQFYPPVIGGEERHVRNLGAALAARGHQVSVATQAGNEPSGMAMDGAVRVWRINGTAQRAGALFSQGDRPFAPPFPDPELVLGLRRVIAAESPEIVHAHNWLLHSYLPLQLFSRVPFIVTLHDYSLLCVRKNFLEMGLDVCGGPGPRKCLACASQQYGVVKGAITAFGNWASAAQERRAVDKFLAVSGAVARINRLAEYGVPFEVVPNFVPDRIGDISAAPDPHLADLPAEYMLYVGDLSVQKGVHLLLEAYRLSGATVPLVMIGRRLPDFPATVPPGVQVFESWPHPAVMQAWQLCLFGLAPSIWHEPCATVVIEAMALGKAMVVSDLGGMPDLVAHMETGLVVQPTVEAMAAAMRRLLDEPALREQLGATAAARVGGFQEHTVVPRIEAIYQTLAAQHAPVTHVPTVGGASGEPVTLGKHSVSVIICAYTMVRWNDLCEAIESLRLQTRLPDDIVVVIDHNDAMLAHARQAGWTDVTVVGNRNAQGLSGARNTGIATAGGDLLVFLDDDAIAAPEWLAEFVRHASAPDILGCTGTVAPHWLGERPRWMPEEFLWTVGCSYRGQPVTLQPVRNVIGASMLIKRSLFDRAGGFSSQLGRSGGTLVSCEETELCIRGAAAFPGGNFLFVPGSRIAHKVPGNRLSWKYFGSRCFAEGRSKAFVATLAQQRGTLDTERNYVQRILLGGVLHGLADTVLRADPAGAARAAAIVFGLGATICGFLAVKLRRQPAVSQPVPAMGAE